MNTETTAACETKKVFKNPLNILILSVSIKGVI